MTRTPPYPSTDDVDLAALWRAVAEKKALLAGLVLSAALATFIALNFVTPLYTSQARILIEHDEPAFLRPRGESGTSDISVMLNPEAVASQVQVLLSRDLAFQVVKDLKLDENPEFNTASGLAEAGKKILVAIGLASAPTVSTREEWALDNFERRLSVYQVAKSRVIAVEFDSENRKTAAQVANRLAEVYLAWAQKTKLAQTRDASHWLSEQIKTLRKRVAESEQAVEKFRSTHGLVGGTNNATLESQQLSELNSQLILARAQRSEAEARASLIRRMLKEKGDVASAPDVLKSALIQRLLEQRVRLRRELAELSATLLPSHPRIRELNSELGDLQRQIRQEAQKVVASLENEAEIAGAREASLRASLNDLKKDASSAREDEIKLRSLEREAKANRDLLESYLARYGEASARRDESSVPAHASIISRARVQREPSFPKKGPISALVAAAVGLLSLATIIGRELMTGAHAHAALRPTYEPVEQESDAAAPEPEMDPAPEPIPVTAPVRNAGALRARSARAAAKIVRGKCAGPQAHSLMVAPASHHANTAQDALDVARALAASGLKVGIVDFSTGGPGVAGLAGLPNIPGLGELLSGAARFEDVIHADAGGTVQIIAPGMLQKEAFGDGEVSQWKRVHNALAQIYDCLILHSSISGARRLLGGMADQAVTVLLVTGGKRDAGLAAQVAEHLSADGGPSVEIVTYNGARPPKDRQGLLTPAGSQAAAV